MELQANKIYTVKETAEILSIRRETLLKLIYAKDLEASKLGRLWRIKGSNIDRFLDNTSNIKNDHVVTGDSMTKSTLEKQKINRVILKVF
ncbi:helix-turn-helix domain-containing protein [Clostridium frigidicarnis]|uniref:DNA binding domain-containing protein, excisionase family n=1 Tax=Clostridium frigidicarnis TaxID=84698 RepID=A0A1I1ANW6_9CLOT|nr:helix-turn-helix domain-containing protein [Clostridium frigidicarnis]SFB38070.1 DNA binding domain-containing protein, excisionase family [Clostridium frigidicarnis]